MPDFPCPPPREGPGQAHSCPQAGPSSPGGTRPRVPGRERATAGAACAHSARSRGSTPPPLLPRIGCCFPLSQGPGGPGVPRPFLCAPLATIGHALSLLQLSTRAQHSSHSPSPPSHTPQLAADSQIPLWVASPLKDPSWPYCLAHQVQVPLPGLRTPPLSGPSPHMPCLLFPFLHSSQPGPPTKMTQNSLVPTSPPARADGPKIFTLDLPRLPTGSVTHTRALPPLCFSSPSSSPPLFHLLKP